MYVSNKPFCVWLNDEYEQKQMQLKRALDNTILPNIAQVYSGQKRYRHRHVYRKFTQGSILESIYRLVKKFIR